MKEKCVIIICDFYETDKNMIKRMVEQRTYFKVIKLNDNEDIMISSAYTR